jgi:hypothetical protein
VAQKKARSCIDNGDASTMAMHQQSWGRDIMEIWLVAETCFDGYYGYSFINPVLFRSAEKALGWVKEVRKLYQLTNVTVMSDLPEATRMIKDWPNAEDFFYASFIEFTFSGETSTNHVMMRMPVIGE